MHALEWTLVTIFDEIRADRLRSERLHQGQMARFDQRFVRIDERLDQVDKRFEQMEHRLAGVLK